MWSVRLIGFIDGSSESPYRLSLGASSMRFPHVSCFVTDPVFAFGDGEIILINWLVLTIDSISDLEDPSKGI